VRKRAIAHLFRRKFNAARSADGMAFLPEEPYRDDEFYRYKVSHRRLLNRYRASQYPGAINLIVNEEQYRFGKDMGWKRVPQAGLIIHKVPGDHWTMLTLHNREVAQAMRVSIDQALEGSSRPAHCTGVAS